jgi:hypothetical protein
LNQKIKLGKAAQLEENLAEVKKGPLSEDELAWMRQIGDYVYSHIRFSPRSRLSFSSGSAIK